MTGIFLQLSRILPDEYPLTDDVDSFLSDELGFGRLLDFGVIVSRLQQIDDWSAHEPGEPGLRACTRDGAMTYAWPFEERGVWQARDSVALQLAHHLLPPTHARQTRAEELTSFRSPGSGVARSVAQWEPEMSPGSGPGREGMVSQRWLTHAG